MNTFAYKNKNGFALLYAVLVASLFLAIGATIASATLKNLIFASSGRESQFAFYSADSGVECALYLDKIGPNRDGLSAFPTSTADRAYSAISALNVKCDNQHLVFAVSAPDSSSAQTTFSIGTGSVADGITCTDVTVSKLPDPANPGGVLTEISSEGYNTCDAANLRRLQRGLLVDY